MASSQAKSLFTAELILPAIKASFLKLHPRDLVRNPVMFVTAAVLGTPVYRDDKDHMTGLLYTTPLGKGSYLGGRFVGSLLAMWFILAGTTVGAWLGMHMPWVEADKLGPVLPGALPVLEWLQAERLLLDK